MKGVVAMVRCMEGSDCGQCYEGVVAMVRSMERLVAMVRDVEK